MASAWVSRSAGQQALLVETVAAAVLPDRHLELVLDGDEVAIRRPLRHPDGLGDLGRGGASLAATLEERHHPIEPGGPVALRAESVALVVDHPIARIVAVCDGHPPGATIVRVASRSVASSSTRIVPWIPPTWRLSAGPFTLPVTRPSSSSVKTQ